jgi:hypothetical protein
MRIHEDKVVVSGTSEDCIAQRIGLDQHGFYTKLSDCDQVGCNDLSLCYKCSRFLGFRHPDKVVRSTFVCPVSGGNVVKENGLSRAEWVICRRKP